MKEKKRLRIAFVGTESLRAKELRSVLDRKHFPLESVDFYDPSVEEEYSKLTSFRDEPRVIHRPDKKSLEGVDLVFLIADQKVNRELAALAPRQGFLAIDLSETFNLDEEVPVVVSGVNDGILSGKRPVLIANPHPATIVLSHMFHIVRAAFGLKKAVSMALQPVSAYEKSGIEELASQSYSLLSSSLLTKKVFREQIAFNLLSQTEKTDADGFTAVEKQISSEICRVLDRQDFPFSLSVIQAPVFFAYSFLTYLELEKKTDVQGLKDLFRVHPLFKVSLSGRSSPVSVARKEEIFLGQVKKIDAIPNSFWVWMVADNLTRGSALNAFEIAERIFLSPQREE